MPRVPRILIIDDFLDMTELLSLFLSRVGGYETRTANYCFEAIRVAEEFRPDIILLDIGMPNLNGFAITKRIRSEPWAKGITFIAMSGFIDEKFERRVYEAGFVEYLPKPIPLKSIVDAIEHCSHVGAATSQPTGDLFTTATRGSASSQGVSTVSFWAVFSRN